MVNLFCLEYAPTGRAACRLCKESIPIHDLRLGKWWCERGDKNGEVWDWRIGDLRGVNADGGYYRWYHWKCALKMVKMKEELRGWCEKDEKGGEEVGIGGDSGEGGQGKVVAEKEKKGKLVITGIKGWRQVEEDDKKEFLRWLLWKVEDEFEVVEPVVAVRQRKKRTWYVEVEVGDEDGDGEGGGAERQSVGQLGQDSAEHGENEEGSNSSEPEWQEVDQQISNAVQKVSLEDNQDALKETVELTTTTAKTGRKIAASRSGSTKPSAAAQKDTQDELRTEIAPAQKGKKIPSRSRIGGEQDSQSSRSRAEKADINTISTMGQPGVRRSTRISAQKVRKDK